MTWQKLAQKGLLKKEKISFEQIAKVLERASENIKSAQLLFEHDHEESAFQFAYQAMLLAGRALVFSFGFRPRTVGSHRIVIEFTKSILGEEYQVLSERFNRLRKKRHYIIYGAGLTISKTEAENAIALAKEFIAKVQEIIQEKNLQKQLL